MHNTPRTLCAPAPTPTILPGELWACSRSSRYSPQLEHARQGRTRAAAPFRAGIGAARAARRASSTSYTSQFRGESTPTPLHSSLTLPRNPQCHARVCFLAPPLSFSFSLTLSTAQLPINLGSYALCVLVAIGTSTGSGRRPRRPPLLLSCTWRTHSQLRRQFVPDKKR
jgi:hypothetical protein